jgi:hypothetical protein
MPPALPLPHVCYGLSVLLMEVFCTLSIASLCRHVQRQSLNFSHFVARQIWRRRGVSPLCGRAHRLQRREPLRGLLVPMDLTFDVLQTAIN